MKLYLNNVGIVGAYAFQSNKITSLHVPVATTSIGSYAFQNNVIETLTFEEGSQLKNIWDYAFQGNKLSELIFPESVIGLFWTMKLSAFRLCEIKALMRILLIL